MTGLHLHSYIRRYVYSDFVCCCDGDFSVVEVDMLQGLGRNPSGKPNSG